MNKVTESVYSNGWDASEKFFEEFKQNNLNSDYLDFLIGFADGLSFMNSAEAECLNDQHCDAYGTAVDSTGHGAHSRVNEND